MGVTNFPRKKVKKAPKEDVREVIVLHHGSGSDIELFVVKRVEQGRFFGIFIIEEKDFSGTILTAFSDYLKPTKVVLYLKLFSHGKQKHATNLETFERTRRMSGNEVYRVE